MTRTDVLQFIDDDWLEANDLLPPTPPATAPSSPSMTARTKSGDPFGGATIRTLRLKPITTVLSDTSCAEAIETMRDKGFDQLPVKAPKGNRLVGLVTLGNLLSYIGSGRATASSPVSSVMFDFSKLSETVTDPKDMYAPQDKVAKLARLSLSDTESHPKRREFVEITRDTPLSALSGFFEWNSAAVVTERGERGEMKPVAVVTKVDLLSWLVKQGKKNGS